MDTKEALAKVSKRRHTREGGYPFIRAIAERVGAKIEAEAKIEFAIGADVTQEFRKAVAEVYGRPKDFSAISNGQVHPA